MESVAKDLRSVNKTDLRNQMKAVYKQVAENPFAGYHFKLGRKLAIQLGYGSELLDQIPVESVDSFAGVGYHLDLAELKAGERILDLGSGSGMDVFYAAQQTGRSGRVYGLDMTDEQLLKSQNLQQKYAFDQVSFVKGYIENIPFSPKSMDVVISNGVINLSNEKPRVFNEINRVLKPGGRLVLSDIVSGRSFPDEITCDATLWAACVAGAMRNDLYQELITDSGLTIQQVKENPYSFISERAKGATHHYGIRSISLVATKA